LINIKIQKKVRCFKVDLICILIASLHM